MATSFFGGAFFGGEFFDSGGGAPPVVVIPAPSGVGHGGGRQYRSLSQYISDFTRRVETEVQELPRKQRRRAKLQRIVVDDRVESLPEVLDLRAELDALYAKTTPLLPTDIATLQLIFAKIEMMRLALLQDDQDIMDIIRLLHDT